MNSSINVLKNAVSIDGLQAEKVAVRYQNAEGRLGTYYVVPLYSYDILDPNTGEVIQGVRVQYLGDLPEGVTNGSMFTIWERGLQVAVATKEMVSISGMKFPQEDALAGQNPRFREAAALVGYGSVPQHLTREMLPARKATKKAKKAKKNRKS